MPALVHAGAEFVDQRGDDRHLRFQQLQQMLAGARILWLQAGGAEGVADLLVQIGAVGHHHDARAGHRHRQRFGQHHHGQRFSRPLRMPDHAAFSTVLVVALLHALQQMLDGEILRMAGDFLVGPVEQHKPSRQIQQAVGAAQTHQRAVQRGRQTVAGVVHREVAATVRGEILEDLVGFDRIQRTCQSSRRSCRHRPPARPTQTTVWPGCRQWRSAHRGRWRRSAAARCRTAPARHRRASGCGSAG